MEKFEVVFVQGIEDDFLRYNIKEETMPEEKSDVKKEKDEEVD